jgi:hypothetical protein
MDHTRADLSILHPFTADEISNYVCFLRRNGAKSVAVSVEAALSEEAEPHEAERARLSSAGH